MAQHVAVGFVTQHGFIVLEITLGYIILWDIWTKCHVAPDFSVLLTTHSLLTHCSRTTKSWLRCFYKWRPQVVEFVISGFDKGSSPASPRPLPKSTATHGQRNRYSRWEWFLTQNTSISISEYAVCDRWKIRFLQTHPWLSLASM